MSYRVLEVERQKSCLDTEVSNDDSICESTGNVGIRVCDDEDFMSSAEKAKLAKRLIKLYQKKNIPIPSFLDPTGSRL